MSEIKISVLEILQLILGIQAVHYQGDPIGFQVRPIDLTPHTLAARFCLEAADRIVWKKFI